MKDEKITKKKEENFFFRVIDVVWGGVEVGRPDKAMSLMG